MSGSVLKSVSNALEVIEILAAEKHPIGVSELSHRMMLGKSTVFRLLSTLAENGYVERNQYGQYTLSVKLVKIADSILANKSIVEICFPFLQEFNERTAETVSMGVYGEKEATCVAKIAGKNTNILGQQVGKSTPLYNCASGKILLAYKSQHIIDNYISNVKLEPWTPYTITDKEELQKTIIQAKENGFSEDQQESEEGLVCFAAPVFNSAGLVIASVSISGPASRMNSNKTEYVPLLKYYANECTKAVGMLGGLGGF